MDFLVPQFFGIHSCTFFHQLTCSHATRLCYEENLSSKNQIENGLKHSTNMQKSCFSSCELSVDHVEFWCINHLVRTYKQLDPFELVNGAYDACMCMCMYNENTWHFAHFDISHWFILIYYFVSCFQGIFVIDKCVALHIFIEYFDIFSSQLSPLPANKDTKNMCCWFYTRCKNLFLKKWNKCVWAQKKLNFKIESIF